MSTLAAATSALYPVQTSSLQKTTSQVTFQKSCVKDCSTLSLLSVLLPSSETEKNLHTGDELFCLWCRHCVPLPRYSSLTTRAGKQPAVPDKWMQNKGFQLSPLCIGCNLIIGASHYTNIPSASDYWSEQCLSCIPP